MLPIFLPEEILSRIIQTEAVGKRRTELCRGVVAAVRQLAQQQQPDDLTKDLAAFIVLSLQEIMETVRGSIVAWEKKGYYVKADRFEMEWIWTERYAEEMKKALLNEDWATLAMCTMRVAEKLKTVKLPVRYKPDGAWVGARNKITG